MPRRPRFADGNFLFHVMNRAVARSVIFESDEDYIAFEDVLQTYVKRLDMRLLSYCLMPNHFHLVLWPRENGALSTFMHRLTSTQTQRWHAFHGTVGTGALYQGRFKSFPIQCDRHLLAVCRYVERNPLRANLVPKAENWRYSSLWMYVNSAADIELSPWPIERPKTWIDYVNEPQTEEELCSIRNSIARGVPFGESQWIAQTAKCLGLESKTRPAGRRPWKMQ